MKKTIACLLALVLLVSLATICFADLGHEDGDSPVGQPHEDPENLTDDSPVSPDTGLCLAPLVLALVLGFAGVIVSHRKLFN